MSDEMRERLDLSGWIARIRDRDMPVFGRTVQAVRSVTEDENASAAALTHVVLQDAALTTKVLKLANSALLNPSRQSISTVSRAVAVLGFDMVGKIVLSIYLIDALLSGGLRERVITEMARSFHAAVQARTAAAAKGLASEEVFIAALLGRVGEMCFWCFGGKTATQLNELMIEQPDEKPEDLQTDLLGFRLCHLTAGLAKEWRLGALVASAVEPSGKPSAEEAAIQHGYKLATAVEGGWETAKARAALNAYADFAGKALQELGEEIRINAAEAAKVAAQFGAEEAARVIPQPSKQVAIDIAAAAADPAPDPLLQLKILRDLSMLLGGRPSLNDVLQLVLEGIYRGLGMSRAVFALQSADRAHVIGKTALGRDAELLLQRFSFLLDGMKSEVVNEVFAKGQAFWLKPPLPAGLRTERLERVTEQAECFLAPISANGRVIGLFYADRCGAGPDEETWQGFLHFAQQASLSFEHVAARGGKR